MTRSEPVKKKWFDLVDKRKILPRWTFENNFMWLSGILFSNTNISLNKFDLVKIGSFIDAECLLKEPRFYNAVITHSELEITYSKAKKKYRFAFGVPAGPLGHKQKYIPFPFLFYSKISYCVISYIGNRFGKTVTNDIICSEIFLRPPGWHFFSSPGVPETKLYFLMALTKTSYAVI